MTFLFIGDSITRGRVGASFVNLFKQECCRCRVRNFGRDGETMEAILQRLTEHLAIDKDYDAVIVQGGYNDILMPSFKNRGRLFRFAFQQQIKKGMRPAENAADFRALLKKYITRIKQLYTGKIIFLTIGCVGEKPDTQLNKKRKNFNNAIRQVAGEENIFLADTESKFDRLNTRNKTNHCLQSFWAVTLTDRIVSLFYNGSDILSRRRNLNLTTDGVHLNNNGAKIFSDSIKEILRD